MLAIVATALPVWGGVLTEELSGSPSHIAFGHITVGQSKTLDVTLTNKGARSVKISRVDSSDARFELSKLDLPKTLAAGEKIKLSVKFVPSVKGRVGAHVTVHSDALNNAVDVAVEGTGEDAAKAELTIAPDRLRFGNVAVGASETLTLDLSAKDGDVTITSLSSSSSQFEVLDDKLPLTIESGKASSINVRFKPQNDGAKEGKLTFVSDAEHSPATESLVGTGTAPFVTLSWIASTSEVSGYNVYRSTSSSGTFAKINSVLDRDTSYSDKSIEDGKTYYYKTTAVNSSGKESGFSDEVEVEVP
jgi:predicted phage tail protein